MNAQRWTGFGLIALQVALVSYVFRDMLVPLLAGGVALAGLIRPLRLKLTLERRVLYGLVLAVAVAAKWRLFPDVSRDNLIMNNGLGVGLAQYLLLLQASLFHLEFANRKHPLALPKTLPAYAVAVLACAGDVTARGTEINVYQFAALAFLVLCAFYLSLSDGYSLSPRRFPARTVVGGLLLLIVAGIAWGSAWLMSTYRQRIDELVLAPFADAFAPTQSVGFSGSARLGSIAHTKSLDEDKAALRVIAESEPGYLRGRAFTEFDGQEWEPEPADLNLVPNEIVPATAHDQPANAFRLAPGDAPWNVYDVWTASDFPVTFTPLRTTILAADTNRLRVSDSGMTEAASLPRYIAYVSREASEADTLSSDRLAQYTAVQARLDPRIHALAAQLFRNCRTVTEKIAAIERYFHTEYQYDLGIQIPPGESPLAYFLLKKPAAHCEYFASGATILLRLGGVPCRYVTGFVASERNEYGGYWVARNRDAHAWVEALDETGVWKIVEATPSNGVPQSREARHAWMDDIRFRWREFWAMNMRDKLKTALAVAAMALIAGGVGAAAYREMRTLRRRWRARGLLAFFRRERSTQVLPSLLVDMDKALRRKGLQRHKSETLHRFAQRLESRQDDGFLNSASSWYRAYAEIRYGPAPDGSSIENLRRRCSDLLALSRKNKHTKDG